MSSYLLHQTLDGTPVGVFTETEHFYFPTDQRHEAYGEGVVADRGSQCPWDDFMEQQASKTPGYRAMWDIYEHDEAPLRTVLLAAKKDTSYPE